MPLELITNRNVSEGIHILFVYVNDITAGLFIDMLLFMIWGVVVFGLFFMQKRTGEADIAACLAAGGFILVIAAILLGLITGLVSVFTYTIVVVVSLTSIMIFLFTR